MAYINYCDDFYDQDVTIKINKDADISGFYETIEKLALAIGYHPNSIKQYFGEEE